MCKERKWFYEAKINTLKGNLRKNNIECYYSDNRSDAKDLIMSHISKEWLIGFGGSTTMKQIGILDELLKGEYNILNRFDPGISKDEKLYIQRSSLLTDLFITGTNAISINGEMVNIDHTGNRVAAMLFGPERVFIIIGINKIVDNLEEAINRAKKTAAPLNAKRAEKEYNPPCLKTARCIECTSDESICCSMVVIKRQSRKGRMKVFVVGEELGF